MVDPGTWTVWSCSKNGDCWSELAITMESTLCCWMSTFISILERTSAGTSAAEFSAF